MQKRKRQNKRTLSTKKRIADRTGPIGGGEGKILSRVYRRDKRAFWEFLLVEDFFRRSTRKTES